MKRLGILTSGGDAPGMNAAIRAAVRCASESGMRAVGIRRGFDGLIDGDAVELDNRAVGGIIERGGTILRTARSSAFRTAEGQERALRTVSSEGLDALMVIGGNGSLRGARWLDEQGIPTIGIPASIDNDVPGTEMAIGVDSALNTLVDCLNRIRDTAIAHERAFVVEVMGRKSGYIALMGGLAGGAEIVLLPEVPTSIELLAERVVSGASRGKRHSIIVVAEGFVPTDEPLAGRSAGRAIADYLEKVDTLETRLTILGHLLRGGSPTAYDRILASRFAASAVSLLREGRHGLMPGVKGERIEPMPLDVVDGEADHVDRAILELLDIVAH